MSDRATDGFHFPRRLLPVNVFDGFGPTRYRPPEEPVIGCRFCSRKPAWLKRQVSRHAPVGPGVYGMIDAHGRLIYVGKAKNLRTRLLSYFRVQSRHPKAGRILQQTYEIVWEQTADEFSALLRELEIIQTRRPRFNVRGVPGRRGQHYLCLGKSPAAHAYVATRPSGSELGIYGPFTVRWKTIEAARKLNDWFRLRDCPRSVPLVFADQPRLIEVNLTPGCLRFELGTCLGPCVAACREGEYATALIRLKAFLDGNDRSLLTAVRDLMETAAGRFEYEKAAALRDRLRVFEWVDARLTWLRDARSGAPCVYPLTGWDGRERWYLISRGQVVSTHFAPDSAIGRAHLLERLSTELSRCGLARSGSRTLTAGNVDNILLVLAWFRKYPGEQKRLIYLGQGQRPPVPLNLLTAEVRPSQL